MIERGLFSPGESSVVSKESFIRGQIDVGILSSRGESIVLELDGGGG